MFSVLLSARADKNTHSDWLYSPTVALISTLANRDSFKIIAQQSQRMGTAGQLYTQDKIGNEPDAETMAGVELIYSNYSVDRFSYNIIGYWNDAEVISWNHKLQSTSNVDDQKSLGFELELKYKMALADIGFNYSVVKQLDWNLADGVSGSGISYSDYNQTLDIPNAIMTGVGNDVNNWPNQAIKIFAHSQLSDKISLYIDSRL